MAQNETQSELNYYEMGVEEGLLLRQINPSWVRIQPSTARADFLRGYYDGSKERVRSTTTA